MAAPESGYTLPHLAQKYDHLLVALGLLAVYFLVVTSFGYLQSLNESLFWAPDAQKYREAGAWLLGRPGADNPLTIPFLYPLLITLVSSLAGNIGIWLTQLVLWVISGVWLYRAVKGATQSLWLAVAGTAIYAGNLTLLLLTLHALAEVTTVFLLTALAAWVVGRPRHQEAAHWLWVIFLLALLSVIKPLYTIFLLAVLIYRVAAWLPRRGGWRLDVRQAAILLLALLPVMVQLAIDQVKLGELTLSHLGPLTMKQYYFARVYGDVNGISIPQARQESQGFDQEAILQYLLSHPGQSIKAYLQSLLENMLARSNFTNFPKPNLFLSITMRLVNMAYFALHVLMLLPGALVVRRLFQEKAWRLLELVLSLLVPVWLIFLTSGLTFAQGDRIILPALPLWISLDALILAWYLQLRKTSRLAEPGAALDPPVPQQTRLQ